MDVVNDPVVVGDLDIIVPDRSVAGGLSSVSSAAVKATGEQRAQAWPGQGAQGVQGPVVATEELVPADPREGLEEPELRDVMECNRTYTE